MPFDDEEDTARPLIKRVQTAEHKADKALEYATRATRIAEGSKTENDAAMQNAGAMVRLQTDTVRTISERVDKLEERIDERFKALLQFSEARANEGRTAAAAKEENQNRRVKKAANTTAWKVGAILSFVQAIIIALIQGWFSRR